MTTFSQHLIHRITFQEPIESKDSEGYPTVEWDNVWLDSDTELADVPAEVLTGPGREFPQSGQIQADIAARIRCPWFPGGINSAWRILWDGFVFNIDGIPDLDATGRREYRIKCKAGVNDG
jgi:SPP1 family predicted phage head-tail adaptor